MLSLNISFSNSLKQNDIDTWNRILNHKFSTDIVENVLPITKFTFYLKQDKIFLRAFCNLLTTASILANDNETKKVIGGLVESTIKYEIPMQDELLHTLDKEYRESGFSTKNVTRDYIRYMNSVSKSGDLGFIISTITPCPWMYYEISTTLIKKNVKSEAFEKWLHFYSSNESAKQVINLKQALDKLDEMGMKRRKWK